MDLIEHFKHARNVVSAAAGETIFRQGELGTVMYVLLEGVALVRAGDTLVELAAPGALLGEMALLEDAPRSATVVAATTCRLVPVPLAQFDLLIRETPAFARKVMSSMAARLRRMNQRVTAKDAVETE
jgi:CRP/FNR family transcriptional regulator, cyclic AMP receptor protein